MTAHLSGGDTDKRVIFLTVGTFQALVNVSEVLLDFLQPQASPLSPHTASQWQEAAAWPLPAALQRGQVTYPTA